MTRDDWWLEYGLPLHEAVDATMDMPEGTSRERRLGLLVEKCPWLRKLPGPVAPGGEPDAPGVPGDEPEWTPVEGSSTIEAIRTEPRSIGVTGKAKLFIRFKSGGTYRYEDVPGSVIVDLIIAESSGRYFAAHIKDKFETTKIADAERAT
jgi:KTSC domain